jgi:predicted negative regulator of RcsB-dependent stress response
VIAHGHADVIFFYAYIFSNYAKGRRIVGTTKLTRKEILAEDPVHLAIVQFLEFFREQGKFIAIAAVGVVVLAIGGYLGVDYLQGREQLIQQQLGRALNIYHARIDPKAAEDPFAKGPEPVFRNDSAKYQAALKELSAIGSKYAAGKLGVTARYYQGLCYLRLGQGNEAVRALEEVRSNTKDRTLGYLAKKVLAGYYLTSKNYKASQEILEGMTKDPQCDLPKDDLNLDLARVADAQGKREEALKILRKIREENAGSALQTLVNQEITRLESSAR